MIAEMSQTFREVDGPDGLQWGRDRMIAEMQETPELQFIILMLQWGRDRMIAEILRDSTLPDRVMGFNGAAIG